MTAPPRKPTILVAEDEAIVARDIRAVLTAMGYEPVAHASSAEQAVALAGAKRPDLVLMDINLAGEMDGITAAQTIRERYALPVVFLTAFSGGETLTRAKLAEPFGYVTKPFNERELHTVIEIALYKHQVEAELRRSETKFRTLYDSTSDAVMLLDEKGFFDCNQATLATFGCTSRELFCTKHPGRLSPPTQPGGVDSMILAQQRIAQATAEGSLRFDWIHQRLDSGALFDAEVLLSAMSLDGRPVLQAVVRDISTRKRAEEELRVAKLLLDSIVENMPAMIFVKRASDLRFELFNRAGETLLGLSRKDLLGKSDHDLFPKAQADAFTAKDRAVIASGEVAKVPVEPILTARGETRYLHTKKVVLHDEAGQASHLLGISLDITEQKQAGEALLAAKEEAERANRAKSHFLSHMSHELRTPLNAVLGFAQLLEHDPAAPLRPHQAEYVRQILRGGSHLLGLIDEVLDLSAVEAGRLTVTLVPVGVAALVTECCNLVQGSALQRGIRLVVADLVDSAAGDDVVMADHTRLRQVLLNLLSNAVKYNRAQGSVEVRCAVEGTQLCISVSDSGPGLSAAQQARLFQLFERLDAGGSTTPGSGIGLALSQRLVHAMQGEIGVDSVVGSGSTFWLRLPRARRSAPG